MTYQRVQRGENVARHLRADVWNDILSATERVRSMGVNGKSGVISSGTSGGVIVPVVNSGPDIAAGQAVGLGDAIFPAGSFDDELSLQGAVAFVAAPPADVWGVAMTAIPSGESGLVTLTGLARAQITIHSADDDYADVVSGSLESVNAGPARILWRQGVGADKWAVLLLSDSAGARRGMFQIMQAGMTTPAEPADGDNPQPPSRLFKVVDGNFPDDESCGVCHVNNQPFTVARSEFTLPAATSYIYIKFTAPVEASEEGADDTPATCEISVQSATQTTTTAVVWYLLGRVRVEGESVTIAQDHEPGNVYIDWFGPCLEKD